MLCIILISTRVEWTLFQGKQLTNNLSLSLCHSSISLSVYLSVHTPSSILAFLCLSVCLFVCLSVCLFVCLSVYLSIHPSFGVWLSIHRSFGGYRKHSYVSSFCVTLNPNFTPTFHRATYITASRRSCTQGAPDFRISCLNYAFKVQRSPLALYTVWKSVQFGTNHKTRLVSLLYYREVIRAIEERKTWALSRIG